MATRSFRSLAATTARLRRSVTPSWDLGEHAGLAAYVARWAALGTVTGVAIGSAVALFLWTLDRVTQLRFENPWLLWWLPAAGLLVGVLYHWLGRSIEGGHNLIMDEIHGPGGGVPARMAPLVLVATMITHLFGGSAGREGTAVQMGGSMASVLTRRLGLDVVSTQTLLTAGIAAGFGAVFGTPLAGAVFALEVLAIGRVEHKSLIPCLIASIAGDLTCSTWGIHHTAYHVASLQDAGFAQLDLTLIGKSVVAGVVFGLASSLFAEATHRLGHLSKRVIRWPVLRPVVGGLLIIGLTYAVGSRDYLGLGVTSPDPHGVSIVSSFNAGGATPWSWLWKVVFTAVTLGFGFKGGEVTPLFFIGATLGNVLAMLLHAPVDLFAALGFVAVFAGATNTPLACTLMGVELFGGASVSYVAIACFFGYLFSGHSGIYLSQRIASAKGDLDVGTGGVEGSLRDVRELRRDEHERRDAHSKTSRARRKRNRSRPGNHASLTPSGGPTAVLTPQPIGGNSVPDSHTVRPRQVGHLRIYLTPKEKRPRRGIKGALFGKSLYMEIIDTAKEDGIPHAVAHTMLYGYSGGTRAERDHPEYGNASLTLCVELIGPTDVLETFIRKHGDLLKGKTIVHKDAEHWDIHPADIASPPDLGEAHLDDE